MLYTKKQFGAELQLKLFTHSTHDAISKWAFDIYMDYCLELESGKEELKFLAEELIGKETNLTLIYSKSDFSKELHAQLDLGYEPKRIGRWTHKMYLQYCNRIDQELEEIMLELCVLEEGSVFEIPESRLRELVRRLELSEKKFNCRVCGHDQGFEPWGVDGKTPTFDICDCCGVQFGYEDCNVIHVKKFRENWINNGAIWFFPKGKPEKWSLEEQLNQIPDEYV